MQADAAEQLLHQLASLDLDAQHLTVVVSKLA
jgi:hypothetical protein